MVKTEDKAVEEIIHFIDLSGFFFLLNFSCQNSQGPH